jgi:hypothetical protein
MDFEEYKDKSIANGKSNGISPVSMHVVKIQLR